MKDECETGTGREGEDSGVLRLGEPRSDEMVLRELHPSATLPPEADQAPGNTLDFRSSDQTLDRYQEVITVAGWHLENYRRNPIVQNAHSYGSLADTIGKSLITEIRSAPDSAAPYLFQRILFAVEENPLAKIAYGLYRGGFLNAVSVGFIPLRWENGSKEAGYRRKYMEQELLEVSAVSIPANPNALTLALKAGAIEKSDLKEWVNVLQMEAGGGREQRGRRTEDGLTAGNAENAEGDTGLAGGRNGGAGGTSPRPSPTDTSSDLRPPSPHPMRRRNESGEREERGGFRPLTKQLDEIRAILRKA